MGEDLSILPLTFFPITRRLYSFVLIALSGNWSHLLIPEMFQLYSYQPAVS